MLGLVLGANAVGAVVVFAYLQFVSEPLTPSSSEEESRTLLVFLSYLAVSVAVGSVAFSRELQPALRLVEGRPGSPRSVLRIPWRMARASFLLWSGAAVVFGGLNARYGANALEVSRVAVGVLLGGLSTSLLTHLLVDRRLRPAYALALTHGVPLAPTVVGIRRRLVLAWALGSGVPLLGIVLASLVREDPPPESVELSVLAAIGLVVGGLGVAVSARSVADRLDRVRDGLRAVRAGDVQVRLLVDEGGELGLLQAGFNDMVAGLAERQRLRELFGRHVGDEVARRALERGGGLGGEVREMSALFVDLIGSTALAASRPPAEVVATLNALFGAVVRCVGVEGGWVNKFEGDGALCVFGAPDERPDHAAAALRTALALRDEVATLAAEHAGLDVGIGVSSGSAVAGNVGADERYEYTVVGDPVNEAARLTDLAKSSPGRLLVSGTAVAAAGADSTAWLELQPIRLRGRATETAVFAPRDPVSPGARSR